MGFARLVAVALLVLASSLSGVSALETGMNPVDDSDSALEPDRLVYDLFEDMDAYSRAPCASMRLMPSDADLQVEPFVTLQSLGLEANGGAAPGGVSPVGTNLILVTYPTSCVVWAQEQIGDSAQDAEQVFQELLP